MSRPLLLIDTVRAADETAPVTTHLFSVVTGDVTHFYGVLGAYPHSYIAGEDGVALSLSALSLLWNGDEVVDTRDVLDGSMR